MRTSPLPFVHGWDGCGVDVTGRTVHQLCGQSLNREASQGPLGLCRDTNLHLLETQPVAILSTGDLKFTDSAAVSK